MYVAKSDCLYINTMISVFDGIPYNQTHYFSKDWSTHQEPQYFNHESVIYIDKAINAHIVYGSAHSHFVIELLPHIIYMIQSLPKDIPILYIKTKYCDMFLKYLEELGYLNFKRFVPTLRHKTYYVKELYISSEWPPCQNDCQRQYSPEFYGRMYKAFVPKDLPFEQRNNIVVIDRGTGARSLSNHGELLEMLNKHGNVINYIGKQWVDMKKIIDLFQSAKIIIGVHVNYI
jgi:hypothetical protein